MLSMHKVRTSNMQGSSLRTFPFNVLSIEVMIKSHEIIHDVNNENIRTLLAVVVRTYNGTPIPYRFLAREIQHTRYG